jgi:hypothetical protein
MAVTGVCEILKAATASKNKDATTYSRTFRVDFDSESRTNVHTALTADDGSNAIPTLNALHPDNANARATDIKPTTNGNTTKMINVSVSYTTATGGGSADENPTARPAEIQWGGNEYEEDVLTDVNGDPVKNSAKEFFSAQPKRLTGLPVLTISKYLTVAQWSSLDVIGLRFTYSSSSFGAGGKTIGSNEALLGLITSTREYINDAFYYKATFPIYLRPDWSEETIEDLGFSELNVAGDPVPIQIEGFAPSFPYPLDGAGARKANADDQGSELTFSYYESSTFPTAYFS